VSASADERLDARAYVALFALALATASLVGSHGLAYWDAGDYVREAIRGEGSGLLLGRPLFLAISRALVRVALRAGAGASAIEPVLRWWWCAIAALSAPLLARLSLLVGARRAGALLAGLALALAPSFAHTAMQVLTDGPAIALSLLALVLAGSACGAGDDSNASAPGVGRGIALGALSGACLGAATATRETAIVHALALALLLRRPSAVLAAAAACGFALVLALAEGRGVGLAMIPGWLRAMHGSAAKHPLAARDVAIAAAWLLALGPLPLALSIVGVRRDLAARAVDRQAARRLAIALPALAAALALLFYPDGAFSPRYQLAVTPMLLVAGAPVADALGRVAARRVASRVASLAAILAALGLLAVRLGARGADALAAEGAAMHVRILAVPDGALVVPGHLCPAYEVAEAARDALRASGATRAVAARRYSIVCPGWGWPTREALFTMLDDARRAGRAVAVDLRDEAWVGAREAAARDDVRAYAAREPSVAPRAGFAIFSPR
jgi:hypothetical protein